MANGRDKIGGAVTRWLILSVVLIVSACSLRPNREQSLSVPPGLNAHAVELGIIMAVLDTTKPPDMTVGQQITDNVLANVLRGYTSLRSRNAWYYEGRAPGEVLAGFQHRGYYMRVRASYTSTFVSLKIIESRGLSQSPDQWSEGEVIHKSALHWLQDLDDRIRRSLGNVAQQQLIQELGKPPAERVNNGA
jgi:hypothetical protein